MTDYLKPPQAAPDYVRLAREARERDEQLGPYVHEEIDGVTLSYARTTDIPALCDAIADLVAEVDGARKRTEAQAREIERLRAKLYPAMPTVEADTVTVRHVVGVRHVAEDEP